MLSKVLDKPSTSPTASCNHGNSSTGRLDNGVSSSSHAGMLCVRMRISPYFISTLIHPISFIALYCGGRDIAQWYSTGRMTMIRSQVHSLAGAMGRIFFFRVHGDNFLLKSSWVQFSSPEFMGTIFFSQVNFLCRLFCSCPLCLRVITVAHKSPPFTPPPPHPYHHSSKGIGGSLQLNTHTPLIQLYRQNRITSDAVQAQCEN